MSSSPPTGVNEQAANANFEFDALNEAVNYRRTLTREFSPYLKGKVLEVGAGIGQMTREFRTLPGITTMAGLEPDHRFHERFAHNNPDVELFHTISAELPENLGLDAIVSINVLEHIEQDQAELASWFRLLRNKQGHACLFVPARPEIYAPIDKDFGHFRRYTKPELERKLTNAGFKVERLVYFNLIGYFAWWFNFKVLQKRTFETGAVRTFDRLIFPAGHWMEERLMRPPIGQSLLAVAKA